MARCELELTSEEDCVLICAHKNVIVTIAAHGAVAAESESSLVIDWKPDCVQCRFTDGLKLKQADPARPEKTLSPVQFIVLHHNDATTPGSTLDFFSDTVNNKDEIGAHYLVDVDGHTIKMAHETIRTNHAGQCYWYGLDSYEGSTTRIGGFEWSDISIGCGSFGTKEFRSLNPA
jgi:N-acetyl-anhydromuramyl-L-alanine amidase AmpD